ncbi:MAG TPA: dipeptidase [Vicinamibacteria bacterium]|jgi:microsomal dipeptidase-like Zn-dependent dipeptidase
MRKARAVSAAAVALLVLMAAAFAFLPGLVERRLGRLGDATLPSVSEGARALHRGLLVADLHADTLLWHRDLLDRGSRGHVDLPRLRDGNVALQFFTVVTKSPRGLNIESNRADTDDITPLAFFQRWPPRTWRSLLARALHQAQRLHEAAARSGGRLVVLRTRADLDRLLERRRTEPQVVGALLGLEGAHALEGDLRSLQALEDAGFRMIGLAHFFDNEWAGSAHGVAKHGLTSYGRALVAELERRHILLDLAHSSPRTIDDVLALARRPLVVSHTGVRGTCDNRRNLSDAHLRAIAATGGVVGIGYWDQAVCGTDPAAIARAVRHALEVAGPEHVGLGSDFDGAVTVPFDTAGLPHLTDALLGAGVPTPLVARAMGGNVVRLLRESLPQ